MRTQASQQQNTPEILVTKDNQELIRLIKKEPKIKCASAVYETNYKGIYVAEKNIEEASDKDVTDIKLSLYMNAKMDYL